MTNIVKFKRDNDDHGTMGAWWISREQERAKAHAEHCKRMFNEEPGYDFVDPLPRDDVPRFQYVIDRRNDDNDRPGWAIWACIALGAFAWPVLAWAVAAIIQGAG